MGAQQSIHAGKAKIDVNVDLSHKILAHILLPHLRGTNSPLSLVIGSLCIKHPNLFGGSEKLDVSCDKGLFDTNVSIACRRPRHEWLSQQTFLVQHSISPVVGVDSLPIDNSHSATGGLNLSRFSAGLHLTEPASSNWSSATSIKVEHVRPLDDEGRSSTRDLDGFPVTYSGKLHDNMLVLKQETRYAKVDDHCFSRFSLQIEQGMPVLSDWLIFNRLKFVGTKGIKLGKAFLMTSLTGGSIVGDMAPYQAFAIGGQGSVRGYGDGAVGTGRSCLVVNNDLTFPLGKMLEGTLFMDYGTDLGSGPLVPGSPAMRQGKPGSGIGVGYGIRFRSPLGLFQLDYALNNCLQKMFYFNFSTNTR
ncbi:Outer envelope protein 39, chloroplastic [Dionaea muscipula]